MTHPTGAQINSDLLRPLFNTSWRFYLLVVIFGGVGLGLTTWMAQAYLGYGITGIRWPIYWGFYVTSFVFWIGHQPRRHADFGDPQAGERWLAPAGDTLRGGDYRLCADDRRAVSDHSPRTPVAGVLALSVSERAHDLAQFPFAARVGFLAINTYLTEACCFSCCQSFRTLPSCATNPRD